MKKFGHRPTYITCDRLREYWSTSWCCFYYGGMPSRVSIVLLRRLWCMFDVGLYLARSSRVPPHVLLALLTTEELTGNHLSPHDEGMSFSHRVKTCSDAVLGMVQYIWRAIKQSLIWFFYWEKVLSGLGDSYFCD